jgi:hypothetical protein
MLKKHPFYILTFNNLLLDTLKASFLFNFHELANGFKYLGYFLKLDRYNFEDWQWLIDKYEKRINHWCNRWLSIGGHLVLIKVVLESHPVYWLALENLPSTILLKIRQLMFNFLWSGSRKKKSIHLCNWKLLARPKLYGRWGLRNLNSFNSAMAENTLWRVLMKDGLWHRIIKDKYLPSLSVSRWLRTISVLRARGFTSMEVFT